MAKKHSRADRAAIRYVGYHEWACGNQNGVAYANGYEAGYEAGFLAGKRRMAKKQKRK